MTHPFRFGVVVSQAVSSEQLRDTARRVEDQGYATALVSDHLDPFTPLAPLPTAMALAAATDELRVGTLVLANELRNAAQVARDALTIDRLSDGRFELGIGLGSRAEDHVPSGVPFPPAHQRLDNLGASVGVLRLLLAGEPAGDLQAPMKPVQRPRVPLLIGATGPRALALAARAADIVGIGYESGSRVSDIGGLPVRMPDGYGPAFVDGQLDDVRAAAGSRFDELEIQSFPLVVYVTPHRAEVAERLAGNTGMSADAFLASPVCLIGTVDEITDELIARRERWAISYVVVSAASADAFAPVVGRLVGT